MEEKTKASYHGFTLLADRASECSQCGLRGWSTRVLNRNGFQLADYRPGPWLSADDAQGWAVELARDEIARLGETRPADFPHWYSH
jgi:hypothetical protein